MSERDDTITRTGWANGAAWQDCAAVESDDGDNVRYTHDRSGAYVELIRDAHSENPLLDAEGVQVAFREGDRHRGTDDPYPRDLGDTEDIEQYFKVERGATGVCVFSAWGSCGESKAAVYVTYDDCPDPAASAKAWADEYQSWADGDVWGIVCGGPGVSEPSCWGFVGLEYAKERALGEFLPYAIGAALDEAREREHWAARDTITTDEQEHTP
jgi:hypothetical protein